MRDWNSFVRARLRIGGLHRRQEILQELADHLEQAEHEGDHDVQVSDWARLSEEIRSAEEDDMRSRLRSLWIPGLTTSIVAVLLLRLVQYADGRAFVMRAVGEPVVLYPQWLVLLPLIGAAGAFVCSRAGGRRWERVVAAVFSSAALLVLFTFLWLGTVVVTLLQASTLSHLRTLCVAFGVFIGVWVLLPGAALALGALPFLRPQKAAEPQEPHPADA